MNYLLEAATLLGIWYTPAHVLALGFAAGKTRTPDAYAAIIGNPPFEGSNFMNQPDSAGIWRVSGRRIRSKRNDPVPVDTIVEVRRYDWGFRHGLAVFFFGRAQAYRPELFDAFWAKIETPEPTTTGQEAGTP